MGFSHLVRLAPTVAAPVKRDSEVRALRLLLLIHEGAPDRPIASRLSSLRPRPAATGSIELPRPARLPERWR